MKLRWAPTVLLLVASATGSSRADEPGTSTPAPSPRAHKNHVRRASADYVGWSRRLTWYFDHETAVELARETGKPLFVIFCRAGTITDPASGKPKCAS